MAKLDTQEGIDWTACELIEPGASITASVAPWQTTKPETHNPSKRSE
jgi:hypothetical protein